MKRRGLAVVLAVVMTAFIFTGCGGNAVSNNQRQAKEQTKKETTTESSKKEETPASSAKVEQSASSAVAPVSASSSQPEVSAKSEEPAQPEAPAEPAPAPASSAEPAPAPEPEPQKVSDDAIRPDVKEAIDSYETFIDRYCEFMSRSDYGDLNWLSDYAKWMEEYSKSEKNFNSLQDKDLTTAEYNYYLEVLMRCNNKLTQTASSM